MRYIKTILLLTIFALSSSGCALYHHYGPYYGTVVDAETKQPLEGAVVLAVYLTEQYITPGGAVQYFLDAQEAVTDKNGEFRIPSLNAFAFRAMSIFDPYPGFKIFKPRYKCYEDSAKFMPNYSLPVDQHVMIELQELKTKNERIRNTDCYPGSVPDQRMRKLIELNNIERADLGLQQSHLPEKIK